MTIMEAENISATTAKGPRCRFCGSGESETVVDLGMSPLCQTHIEPDQLNCMEPFFPLHAYVCRNCFLVQLDEYVAPDDIFGDYAYFSSFSDSWVEHARRYVEMISDKLELNENSLVMEIASNDGYLLQHFVNKKIPVVGIEPAGNIAAVANEKGITTVNEFFGESFAERLAQEKGKPDLLLGNNVLAHVPDLNDFVAGMKALLKDSGVITMEFPHLMKLMAENQFDTIYHEHFSYFSFYTVEQVFAHHGLNIFDVEQLPSHGGSLRIYACHSERDEVSKTARLEALRAEELDAGVNDMAYYKAFEEKVKATKRSILRFLIAARDEGKRVVGYGAPGKGNTLLNYCGIRTDFLDFTVDRSPHKQGRYTPGTRIPILHPDEIMRARPDYVFILPWNLTREISEQMSGIREWGGKFVVPIPELKVID